MTVSMLMAFSFSAREQNELFVLRPLLLLCLYAYIFLFVKCFELAFDIGEKCYINSFFIININISTSHVIKY